LIQQTLHIPNTGGEENLFPPGKKQSPRRWRILTVSASMGAIA
jgi:hypothetical protein